MQGELTAEGFPAPPSDIGIYIIYSESWKFYVGQSTQLKKRKYEHLRLLRKGEHTNKHLQRSFEKHGQLKYMVVEYLKEPDVGLLTEREQYWMDRLGAYDDGMNQTPAAASSLGCVRTDEQRKVISDITKEFWGKEENRKAQSERKRRFHEKNPKHLVLMSKITKERLEQRPELVENHSAYMKEVSNTPEAIETFNRRMSEWRKTQSKEAMSERAKKSQATKAQQSDEYKRKMAIKSRITKTTNMVGESGVEWHRSKSRQGKPRLDATARWMDVDGKVHMKRFAVAKYGLVVAHYKAYVMRDAVRERLLKELEEIFKSL